MPLCSVVSPIGERFVSFIGACNFLSDTSEAFLCGSGKFSPFPRVPQCPQRLEDQRQLVAHGGQGSASDHIEWAKIQELVCGAHPSPPKRISCAHHLPHSLKVMGGWCHYVYYKGLSAAKGSACQITLVLSGLPTAPNRRTPSLDLEPAAPMPLQPLLHPVPTSSPSDRNVWRGRTESDMGAGYGIDKIHTWRSPPAPSRPLECTLLCFGLSASAMTVCCWNITSPPAVLCSMYGWSEVQLMWGSYSFRSQFYFGTKCPHLLRSPGSDVNRAVCEQISNR